MGVVGVVAVRRWGLGLWAVVAVRRWGWLVAALHGAGGDGILARFIVPLAPC